MVASVDVMLPADLDGRPDAIIRTLHAWRHEMAAVTGSDAQRSREMMICDCSFCTER